MSGACALGHRPGRPACPARNFLFPRPQKPYADRAVAVQAGCRPLKAYGSAVSRALPRCVKPPRAGALSSLHCGLGGHRVSPPWFCRSILANTCSRGGSWPCASRRCASKASARASGSAASKGYLHRGQRIETGTSRSLHRGASEASRHGATLRRERALFGLEPWCWRSITGTRRPPAGSSRSCEWRSGSATHSSRRPSPVAGGS
jgi:hypothetical protein